METAGQEGCLEEAALLSSLERQASRYLLGRKAHQAEGTAKARAEGAGGAQGPAAQGRAWSLASVLGTQGSGVGGGPREGAGARSWKALCLGVWTVAGASMELTGEPCDQVRVCVPAGKSPSLSFVSFCLALCHTS